MIQRIDIIPRTLFLKDREREVSEVRLLNEAEKIAGNNASFIILDAGKDIICDWCNGNIDNPLVLIINDRDAVCECCVSQELERGA